MKGPPTPSGSILRAQLQGRIKNESCRPKHTGILKLVIPLREQAEAALGTANNNLEQQWQIKIDADIDEVIKTIQRLGLKPDTKITAIR